MGGRKNLKGIERGLNMGFLLLKLWKFYNSPALSRLEKLPPSACYSSTRDLGGFGDETLVNR